jgi:hypothetical protein
VLGFAQIRRETSILATVAKITGSRNCGANPQVRTARPRNKKSGRTEARPPICSS